LHDSNVGTVDVEASGSLFPLIFSLSLYAVCWICHSVITVKYKVRESIVLGLLNFVCGVLSNMKLFSAVPAKIT
jgi:hypothetical protein